MGVIVGGNVTSSYSSAELAQQGKGFGLGDRLCTHDGKEYVWVQANGAIVANDVVIITEAYQADQADTTNSATAFGDLAGVAAGAFDDNDYGWIQVKGPCTINVATSCATNIALNTTATVGRIDDDASVGAEVISGLATTGAEASNAAAGILNYPTVGATL